MSELPLLTGIDAVTVPVPDLDAGLAFYRDRLGIPCSGVTTSSARRGLGLGSERTELVLTTRHRYGPTWLVSSVDAAVAAMSDAGGRLAVVAGPVRQ